MVAERSLSELALDLAHNAGDLIRNEVRLARTEAIESLKGMGGGLVRVGLGVAAVGAGITVALGALALGFAEIMPLWAAALLSGLVGAIGGYLVIKSGVKALSQKSLALDRTTEQVSRDITLLKEKVSP